MVKACIDKIAVLIRCCLKVALKDNTWVLLLFAFLSIVKIIDTYSCQWKDSERANEESWFVSEKIEVWKML